MHDFESMANRVIADLGATLPIRLPSGEEATIQACIFQQNSNPGVYATAYVPLTERTPVQGSQITRGTEILEIVQAQRQLTHWACDLRKRAEIR